MQVHLGVGARYDEAVGMQTYGGDRSSRIIRAPEHQAAMAHAAAVMASVGTTLKMPAEEKQYWIGVRDKHVALTDSLYNASAGWWCDFNSQTNEWQSGCNDVGAATGNMGAGKQTYQLAPLFFHSPALGVDLLRGVSKPALTGMIDSVTSECDKIYTAASCRLAEFSLIYRSICDAL